MTPKSFLVLFLNSEQRLEEVLKIVQTTHQWKSSAACLRATGKKSGPSYSHCPQKPTCLSLSEHEHACVHAYTHARASGKCGHEGHLRGADPTCHEWLCRYPWSDCVSSSRPWSLSRKARTVAVQLWLSRCLASWRSF